MKLLVVTLAAISMTMLSACVAELFVIRTVEEIQRSEYRAEQVSPKSPDIVTRCMMQTLYGHTNAKGVRPYAEGLTTQTFGSTQAITLRTGQNLATKMYGGGDELLFLIENSVRDGGTKANFWVNQQSFPSSARAYLDTLMSVVKDCL